MTPDEMCKHSADIQDVVPIATDHCPECVARGDTWVHLRVCLTCGHIGCCDQSKNRHARRHFNTTKHAVIQSFEPGETWCYCFADDLMLEDRPSLRDAHRST